MSRLLRYISIACSAFIIAWLTIFVVAQLSSASNEQVSALGVPLPTPAHAPAHHEPGQPKRMIDNVANKLVSPFTHIVKTNNAWVNHLLPGVLGLLVYGVGIGYLSRWRTGRPHQFGVARD